MGGSAGPPLFPVAKVGAVHVAVAVEIAVRLRGARGRAKTALKFQKVGAGRLDRVRWDVQGGRIGGGVNRPEKHDVAACRKRRHAAGHN
jgi:hypothetical protein